MACFIEYTWKGFVIGCLSPFSLVVYSPVEVPNVLNVSPVGVAVKAKND